MNQHWTIVVNLLSKWWDSNPHALQHQILSLARIPISPHSEKKHSNDFRSHICQFPVEFIAPTTRTKEPYLYFCNLVSTLYLKLFHIAPQLEMLYCGSGRDRTYSALQQQIYSLSRLSNCGADPYAPISLFYNHPTNHFKMKVINQEYTSSQWSGLYSKRVVHLTNGFFLIEESFLCASHKDVTTSPSRPFVPL